MQYPKRMRQMRARAFALRDVFPDVLRGLPVAEEVMDMPVDMGPANVVTSAAGSGLSDELLREGWAAADKGMVAFGPWFNSLPKSTEGPHRAIVQPHRQAMLDKAKEVDAARTVDADTKPATKSAAGPIDPPTAEQVLERINAAKNLDALMVAADWINAITDTDAAEKLTARYMERSAEFEGK
jgi:hypothetical protein